LLKALRRRPKCGDVRGKLTIGAAAAVLALAWVTAVDPADASFTKSTTSPATLVYRFALSVQTVAAAQAATATAAFTREARS
jgi:hypothetical protein